MISVVKPGLSTTVQDPGREGYYDVGIPPSGALDGFSLTAANLLVGNDEGAAGLECAYMGPELEFGEDAVVAVGGGRDDAAAWTATSSRCGRRSRSRRAPRCRFAHLRGGARAYVAVAGGIDVPELLGSRSTYALGVARRASRAARWRRATRCRSARPRRASRAAVPEELRPAFAHRARDPRRDGPLRPPADRRRAAHVRRDRRGR